MSIELSNKYKFDSPLKMIHNNKKDNFLITTWDYCEIQSGCACIVDIIFELFMAYVK